VSMYKILLNSFKVYNYGSCYRYDNTKKGVRYFADEFIKNQVLNWYEENINTLELEFDSVSDFDNIKKLIVRHYKEEVKKFNQKYSEINARLSENNKTISMDKLLQMKAYDWIGVANIVVFNRFIAKTIFKNL